MSRMPIRDFEIGWAMPSRIVEHEQDNAAQARFGFPREGFKQSLEKILRYAVGDIPECFAGCWRCERRDIEPIEPVMSRRDRTLADRRPHPTRDRLQADAVLVCRKDLD